MRTFWRISLLAGLFLCGPALAQSVVYVDDDNCPGPGTGTEGDPFCAITAAIDAAAEGDTVQVMPGLYGECVNTGGKRLAIVADDSDPALDARDFIIDGGNTCVPVTLGGDSGLDGFTVRNGNNSGIRAFGSVAITNNIITGNSTPDWGGGLYVYTGAGGGTYFVYEDVEVTIEDNTIEGNSAATEGGGAYLYGSGGFSFQSLIRFQDNTVTGNSVTGNAAFVSAQGGGISAWTNAGVQAGSEIVISRNVISGNSATYSEPNFAYGGGVSAYTFGFGSERITIEDNTVSGNSVDGDGGGISAWVLGDDGVTQTRTIVCADNDVTGNSATDNGGGIDLYMVGLDLRINREIHLVASGNTVLSNTAGRSGGGIVATVYTDDGEPTINTTGTLEIDHNLVVQNSTAGFGGGLDLFVQAFSTTEGTIDLGFNTVAGNVAGAGAGGVSVGAGSAGDLTETGTVTFIIENSIVSGNTGYGIGLILDESEGVLDLDGIEYNLVHGNSAGDYDTAIATLADIGNSTNVSVDPLLDENWIPDVCSPAIDGADPAADYSQEPQPNGERANLGFLGGGPEATRILPDTNGDGAIDGLDILDLAVAFASGPGDPRYSVSADIDLNDFVDGLDLAQVAARFGTVCP
jgi:hypothetical protein